MTDLIACLSTGKGTWSEVAKLIRAEDWNKIYLITNSFGKEKFAPIEDKDITFIVIDNRAKPDVIKKEIIKELDGKVQGDVAVNFASGTGNEHMGLLSALFSLGVGIRLVAPNETSGFEEL